jgi:hypothetical protein
VIIRIEPHKAHTGLTQCYNCQEFGHVWANCKQLPVVCSVGAVTCTRSAQRRTTQHGYRHDAAASWWTERNLNPPTVEASAMPGKRRRTKQQTEPMTTRGRIFPFSHTTPKLSFAAVLSGSPQQPQQPQPASVAEACPATVREMSAPVRHNQQ